MQFETITFLKNRIATIILNRLKVPKGPLSGNEIVYYLKTDNPFMPGHAQMAHYLLKKRACFGG